MTPQLSGRSIFMTGGTGFVGRTLLDYLIDLSAEQAQIFELTVLSRDPAAFQAKYPQYAGLPWLHFIRGSLKELPSPDCHFSDVIHAAADTHLQGHGAEWIDQIVNGTRAVLDFAVKSGAGRFLHTSSGAVYGPQPDDVAEISEDYLGAPPTTSLSSTYGLAKRVAEQLCTIYFYEYGLQAINARCFAFAGKHLPLNGPYALGNFIRDAMHSDAIRIRGDGMAIRSYLDGSEMAYWLVCLLLSGRPGESYNVGSNEGISIRALAHKVADLLSPGKRVVVESELFEKSTRSRYVPAIHKIAELGLKPKYSLDQAILRSTQDNSSIGGA
jgi:nucleoside-diphosphate-sugar epimerase